MVFFRLVALLIGALAAPDAGPRVETRGAAPFRPDPLLVHGAVEAVAGPGMRVASMAWPADSSGVAIIVHGEGEGGELEASEIRRIFLLRQRYWKDGTAVAPVNLPAASLLRDQFSHLVLGQSARDLAEYWKDLYFHGTQPPPVLDSEEAVALYVSRTAGAIGYVSLDFLRNAPIPVGVRVARVLVTGEGEEQAGTFLREWD
jgi:hypothetical protein